MKKILILIFIITGIFYINIDKTYAYGASVSTQNIYVGDNVTLYFESSGMYGQIIGYSNNTGILNGGDIRFIEKYSNATAAFNFTGINAGTTTLCVGPYAEDAWNNEDNEFTDTQCILVNVYNRPTPQPIDINITYSDNNFLSSLKINDQTITPEFNKDTLEYNVELDYTIDKIHIEANPEDSKSRVVGAGDIEVNEGNNEIKITVIAENGNERTYTINAKVLELNPIVVQIDNKDYHIVKKESLIEDIEGFTKTTIKMNDEDIPVLVNEKTNYTLIGLRDEKGTVNMFVYDKKEESYTPYIEINTNGLRINYLENNDVDYEKEELEINDKKIIAYKKEGLSYYLIYGTNIETGKTNWYTYDKEEKTLQKYNEKDYKIENKIENKRIIIILSSLIFIMTFFLLILCIKYKKRVILK